MSEFVSKDYKEQLYMITESRVRYEHDSKKLALETVGNWNRT